MLSSKKSAFKRILIIIIASLVIFCSVSLIATKIIYDGIFARYGTADTDIPDALEDMVSARQAEFYYSGENRLAGYLYRPKDEVKRDALVIIAPGFHAGADDYLWQINSLIEYGWSVFAFDTTGSFGSEGDSSVGFPQELSDMRATLDYVESKGRFGCSEIALLGHSRGGYAVCCALGYEYDISAVVSVSGVNSAMEGVLSPTVEQVGFIAYGNYGFLWLYQTVLFGADVTNMSASEEISQSDTPVLIVHGSNDREFGNDRFSIISHRDEIDSDEVEYYICDAPQQNGHTNLLFDTDGTANKKLMSKINEFFVKSIN